MPKYLAFVCLLVSLVNSIPTQGITIYADGQSKASIVVADDAIEPEKHAANELSYFLNQVTGGTFDVACKADSTTNRLLVGPGAAKLADPNFSTEGLGHEGIVIRTVGNDLILAGGRPRGTLYAVYTFLENEAGCRWWSSKGCTIPQKAALRVEKLNVRFVPKLEYREPFWFDAFDGDWAVRNKANGHQARLGVKHGGKHNYEGFVHTFYRLIPPEKYFKDHPEWFSEIDGKRQHERAQLCLTNVEMRKELIKNLKLRLRNNPSATIASVSQNDCYGNCDCAQCKAVDRQEGSPSGSLLRFVNAVAKDIESEFPNVAISTLAYLYTRKPPKHVKPRPNVIIRLCSIECSFSKPLSDERNKDFRDDIVGWSKICNRLYIWDYTTNFAHYILPHPNLRVLGQNVKFFVDHGAKGVFEQGAYHSYGAEMAELRAWVLAKLLWDPSLDANKLVDEFLDGYYGPAAPYLRAYLKLTHDAVEAGGDYLPCYSPANAGFLSLKILCEAMRLLHAAEEATGDDRTLRQRVRVAQLPILYVFMERWDSLRREAQEIGSDWPLTDSIQAVYEKFMEIAESEKVTFISEGRRIDQLKRVLERPHRSIPGPPPGCASLSRESWIDIQDSEFKLSGESWVKWAADPMASDGAAARMTANHHEWATQCSLTQNLVKKSEGKPLRCKLSIRCELTGNQGGAFRCGIYDSENKRSVTHLAVACNDIDDDKYHTYDLGVHQLTERMYVWIAPVQNEENIKSIWVDRIWLVRE